MVIINIESSMITILEHAECPYPNAGICTTDAVNSYGTVWCQCESDNGVKIAGYSIYSGSTVALYEEIKNVSVNLTGS